MLEHPVVFLPFQKHPVSLQASSLEPLLFYLSFNTLCLDKFFSKMQSFNLRGNCHSTAGGSIIPHSALVSRCRGFFLDSVTAFQSFWMLLLSPEITDYSLPKNTTIIPSFCLSEMLTEVSCSSSHMLWGPCACSGNPLKCVSFIQLLKSRWGSVDRSLNRNCALWD